MDEFIDENPIVDDERMEATETTEAALTPDRSVEIPLRENPDEVIVIDFNELPPGDDALNILKSEKANLKIWIRLAIAYYDKNDEDTFVRILQKSGESDGADITAREDYPKEMADEDKMTVLDTLAAYHVKKAKEQKDKEQRIALMNKASVLYSHADKLSMYNLNHLLGRAYFCLADNDAKEVEHAESQFNFVLNQQPNCIPALLGKAAIQSIKNDYKNALFFYKKALKFKPDCPADVRVGIGNSFFKLGNLQKAKMAFDRAVMLDQNNINALVGSALCVNNTDKTEEGRKIALKYLGRTYISEEGRRSAMALNQLAHQCFRKKEYNETLQFAHFAFGLTNQDDMRAESCYHIARVHHVRKEYDQAFRFYYQSTHLANEKHKDFVLPWYGLGQLYIHRNDNEQAIACFERVHDKYPRNYEAAKILASLYAQVPHADNPNSEESRMRRHKARKIFSDVVEQQPEDIEAWLDYAQILEETDHQMALQAYAKSDQLLHDAFDVSKEQACFLPEIQINQGSIYFAMERYHEAHKCFTAALVKIDDDLSNNEPDAPTLKITCQYNLARVSESLNDFENAERLYKEIIKTNSKYVDCYMRLGVICHNRGQIHDASNWWKEALSVTQENVDCWSLLACQHFASREWNPAQKKFEQILQRDKHDVYSVVGIGNIWLEQLTSIRKLNDPASKEKRNKMRNRAQDFYLKALKMEPNCIWAAHGIGCVLATIREFEDARDTFSLVREATASFPDVWINLAQVYYYQNQYDAAITLLSNCMEKFKLYSSPRINKVLARVYCKAKQPDKALRLLQKAYMIQPNDGQIMMNIALLCKYLANKQIADKKASSIQIANAQVQLKTAIKYFEVLAKMMNSRATESMTHVHMGLASEANKCFAQCKATLDKIPMYLQRAAAQDELQRLTREKMDADRAALISKRDEEIRAREEEARIKLAEMEAKRAEYKAKTKGFLFIPKVEEPIRQSIRGRGKKSRNDDFVNDSSEDSNADGEEGNEKLDSIDRAKRRKERRELKKKMRRQKQKEKQRQKEQAQLSAKQQSKIKSKAYISDSDSSSDGAQKKAKKSSGSDSNLSAKPTKSGSDSGDSAPPAPRRGNFDTSSSDSESNGHKKSKKSGSDTEDAPKRLRKKVRRRKNVSSSESEKKPATSDEDETKTPSPSKTKRKAVMSSGDEEDSQSMKPEQEKTASSPLEEDENSPKEKSPSPAFPDYNSSGEEIQK